MDINIQKWFFNLNIKFILHSTQDDDSYKNMSKLPKEIIDNKNYKVNDLGIEIFQRDASAYHIPEGLI